MHTCTSKYNLIHICIYIYNNFNNFNKYVCMDIYLFK